MKHIKQLKVKRGSLVRTRGSSRGSLNSNLKSITREQNSFRFVNNFYPFIERQLSIVLLSVLLEI
jgi:hypothetical protein